MSDILDTKHEAGMKIQKRTDEIEEVTGTALSLLDIALGAYFVKLYGYQLALEKLCH